MIGANVVRPEFRMESFEGIQTVAYALDLKDGAARDEAFVSALRAAFAEPVVWAVLAVDATESEGSWEGWAWRLIGRMSARWCGGRCRARRG